MRSLFAAKINQAVNTLIDSEIITLSGIGTNVPLSLIAGTVYKNGVSVTGVNVSDGDTIRMRVRSSTGYATPAFGIIKIGTEETIFSVVTLADPVPIPITGGDTVLPFDVTKYPDGREYIPSQAGNEVSVYSGGALVTKVPLVAPAVNTNKTTDAIVIANYYGNNVFFLNNAYSVIASINTGVGSKPYGIAVTQTTLFDDDALTWITLSGLNQVRVINKNYATVATYSTSARPMGIASSPDRRHVYVANYAANNVTHFRFVNGTWTQVTINVGTKPFEIVCDANNDAWVTCSDDKVYRVLTTNGVTVHTVTGTTGIRGITIGNDGTIWVAGSKSNTIANLSAAGALIRTVSTNVYPYALNTAADGSIQVATFGTSQVYSFAADGTPVSVIDVDKMPYGMATYNDAMIVANLYANTPDYAMPKDQTPEQFSLADPETIPKKTVFQSSEITVTGLSVPCTAAVPDVFGAKLVKNGSVVGASVSVTNNDKLKVQFTSPDSYSTAINIPLFVGNVTDSVVTRTEYEDRTPDAFAFDAVPDALPDTDYISSEITITGITEISTVPFSVDVGIIILNGVEQPLKSISAKLNDKIRLKMRSSVTDRETLFVTVKAGITDATSQPVQTIWRVTTKVVIKELWIKPDHKGLDEWEPGFPASTSAAGRYITKINFANSIQSIPIANSVETYVNKALLIPSYYDGAVYQLNNGGFKVISQFALDTNKRPVDIAAQRFIAYTGSNNRVMDITTGFTTTLPGVPRKIIYDELTDTIYVSMSNSSIAQLKLVAGHYEIVKTFTISNTSPYALAIDADGYLWFSDIKNQVVRHIDPTGVVGAQIIAGGQGIWDMAISGGSLWTANSYDNTISKIDLASRTVTTIKSGWVPTQIEVDTNGNVWVGCYASKNVLKYDSNGVQTFEAKMQYASPTYMTKFDGAIYITELCVGIVEVQDKVSLLKPLVLIFKDAIDALSDERVKSNVVTVMGLIRPTEAFIEPNNNYELIVNGVKVPSGKKVIDNGDTVQLEVVAPHESYTEKVATLNDYQSTNNFLVRTETDQKPDLVVFPDMYGAIPQVDVESTTALIKGMDDSAAISLHVARFGWKIKVNGGEALDEVIVKNGDIITLFGPSRASYTNPDTLDSKSSYPLIAGRHDYLLGTWTVHGKDIIGGMVLNLNKRYDIVADKFDLRRTNNQMFDSDKVAAYERRTPADAVMIVDAPAVFELRKKRKYESAIASFEQQPVKTQLDVQLEAEVRTVTRIDAEMIFGFRSTTTGVHEVPVLFEANTNRPLEFERVFEPNVHTHVDFMPIFELATPVFAEPVEAIYEVASRPKLDAEVVYTVRLNTQRYDVETLADGTGSRGRNENVDEALFDVHATSAIEAVSEVMADVMPRAYAESIEDVPPADVMQTAQFDIDVVIEKSSYVVSEYSFFEEAAVEGAWDTPQLAVAAGILAGYPKAFAVEMRPNRFVFASPIDDGDMCGLPIPVDNSDQANARGYVRGG